MTPHAGQPVVWAGAPLGQSDVAVIAVHGRGGAPRNILDVAARFERPDVTYVAPAAAGNTWYPLSFLSPIPKNEPGMSAGLAVIGGLVDFLVTRGVRKDRVVLMGFSQGACLAGEFSVRRASRYGGVLMFSGGLIGPPGTTWNYPGSFGGTPVFLGCSDVDSHIPAARVQESADVFSRMGADVTMRLYPGMGHSVNDDEIAVAQGVLDALRVAR
jgi:predicted esterase